MPSRKILLADDSITIQKVVNLTFAEEGIEVITTGDGDMALARIWEDRPDLVLADVNMPGANGYQVCEALRRTEATQHIPVILLVGSFEPFDEAEAKRVGANAYLTKPFHSIRQLVDQVSALMPEDGADQAEPPKATVPGDDIETLYERSMSEPEPEHDPSTREYEFGDQGMDDELIETEQMTEPAEQPPAVTAAFDETFENVHDEQLGGNVELPPVEDLGEPVSEAQFERFDAAPVTEVFSQEPERESYLPEPERFGGQEPYRPEPEVVEFDEAPAGFERFAEPSTLEEPRREEAVEQPPQWSEAPAYEQPAGQQTQWRDASPFEETVQYDAPEAGVEVGQYEAPQDDYQRPQEHEYQAPSHEQPYQPGHFVQESFVHNEPEDSFESNPFQATTEEFSRSEAGLEIPQAPVAHGQPMTQEEMELLELPPTDDNETVELTTTERAALMGSNKQIVTISPELMEEIVQQVVERLSSKY
ncbi:MAG TPA: response regulator [Pyrinomonadaceae bacterium]|nr:response regulator [Pyrinomonadaceae bacterium]